jgi:hypothetical protein
MTKKTDSNANIKPKDAGLDHISGRITAGKSAFLNAHKKIEDIFNMFLTENVYPSRHIEQLSREIFDYASREPDVAIFLINEQRNRTVVEHSRDVCFMVAAIGSEIGLDHDTLLDTITAAYLHDIGKLRFRGLLRKRSALTISEVALLATHPIMGKLLLAETRSAPAHIMALVEHHHKFLSNLHNIFVSKYRAAFELLSVCNKYCSRVNPLRFYRSQTPQAVVREIMRLKNTYNYTLMEAFQNAIGAHPTNCYYNLTDNSIGVIVPHSAKRGSSGMVIIDPANPKKSMRYVESIDTLLPSDLRQSIPPQEVPPLVLKRLTAHL